jgi:hypothetical protein
MVLVPSPFGRGLGFCAGMRLFRESTWMCVAMRVGFEFKYCILILLRPSSRPSPKGRRSKTKTDFDSNYFRRIGG